MNRYLLLTVVAGGVIISDQISKHVVQRMMILHDYKEVVPGFFNLTYIHNRGAAFGLFGGAANSLRLSLLIGVSLFALIILFIMYLRTTERDLLVHTSLAMIIGGAIGNLLDRIRFRMVIDFLDFYWRDFHWPAFNIADSAITVGTIMLMYVFMFSRKDLLNI